MLTHFWLSYDDGPKELTRQFLQKLSDESIKATFFVIGSNIVANPEWAGNLKAAFDAGHQIA